MRTRLSGTRELISFPIVDRAALSRSVKKRKNSH